MVKKIIVAMAETVAKETGVTVPYHVGTMIELPRAALQRGRDRQERRVLLVRHQRPHPDHARRVARRRGLVPRHLHEKGLLPADPFVTLDKEGVGELSRSPSSAAARRGPTSSSASAANMAAIRRASRFCESVEARLCLVLAVPRADRPAGGGAGGARPVGRGPNGLMLKRGRGGNPRDLTAADPSDGAGGAARFRVDLERLPQRGAGKGRAARTARRTRRRIETRRSAFGALGVADPHGANIEPAPRTARAPRGQEPSICKIGPLRVGFDRLHLNS